jgi:hypothetical protein
MEPIKWSTTSLYMEMYQIRRNNMSYDLNDEIYTTLAVDIGLRLFHELSSLLDEQQSYMI